MDKLFIDESGNTGSIQQKKEENELNFKDQQYFTLGGMMISSEMEQVLQQRIDEIFLRNKIEDELKFSNKLFRNNENILIDIEEMVTEFNITLFFDVCNKRFKICQYITEYCIYPYYSTGGVELQLGSKNLKTFKLAIANIIYQNIPDDILLEFCNIVNSASKDNEVLLKYLLILKSNIQVRYLENHIEDTIDIVKNYKDYNLSISNLFPLVDHTNKNKKAVVISPNVDAFNNLLLRYQQLSENIVIIHDEQKQFSNALTKWSLYNDGELSFDFVKSIDFIDSIKNRNLQVIDYLTGWVNEHFKASLYKNKTRGFIYRLIHENTNIVSNFQETKGVLNGNYPWDIEKSYLEFYNGIISMNEKN